jgi:hypothetical protein
MKKIISPLHIALVLLLILPFSASYGQTDIRKKLMSNVVTVANGNYSIKEYGRIQTFDKDYEVQLSATAPQALISRDNFLRIYGSLSSSVFETFLRQDGVKTPDDLNLVRRQAPPKEPIDITVTITMSDKGIHYNVEKPGTKSQMDLTWEQLFFSMD